MLPVPSSPVQGSRRPPLRRRWRRRSGPAQWSRRCAMQRAEPSAHRNAHVGAQCTAEAAIEGSSPRSSESVAGRSGHAMITQVINAAEKRIGPSQCSRRWQGAAGSLRRGSQRRGSLRLGRCASAALSAGFVVRAVWRRGTPMYRPLLDVRVGRTTSGVAPGPIHRRNASQSAVPDESGRSIGRRRRGASRDRPGTARSPRCYASATARHHRWHHVGRDQARAAAPRAARE